MAGRVQIYRVQDKEGRGPWRPGFSHRWVEDRDDHDNLLPWTEEFGRVDFNARTQAHIGCGCESLKQLRRWFTASEYEKLIGFGYQAVKLDVHRILGRSKIQCVFERKKPLWRNAQPVELYAP